MLTKILLLFCVFSKVRCLNPIFRKQMLEKTKINNYKLNHAVEYGARVAKLKDLQVEATKYLDTDFADLKDITMEYFINPGKQIRMVIILLLGKILDAPREKVESLALITELIHVASILHDDILDEATMRRGQLVLHKKYSQKLAILGGDFMLAKASVELASLKNPGIQLYMSNALASMVEGELIQTNIESGLDKYNDKIYCKTAALFMNSCNSVSLLSEAKDINLLNLREFGYHFGMAFQIMDDIDDFLNGDDIRQGSVTAPMIYSIEKDPRLKKQFTKPKWRRPVKKIIKNVWNVGGIMDTERLGSNNVRFALHYLSELKDCEEKKALLNITQSLIL